MTLIAVKQNRTATRDITIKQSDGSAIIPGSNDQIRATILHLGETPKLTVASNAPGPNGSTFTKNSPSNGINRLRLDEADLTFEPGIYTLMLDFLDNEDGADFKDIDRQVFHLEET